MNLFLAPDTTSTFVTLSPDDSRHCIRVLRMQAGDPLAITSGDGTLCHARIINPDPRGCEVEITQRIENYSPRPFHLHLAVAPTKNTARIEWLLEKAVEIGIDRFTPIVCDHSERATLNNERLRKIALSAMKQSLKASLPTIDPPTPFAQLDSLVLPGCQRFVCYCSGNERHTLPQLYHPHNNALVLIGPEGDFSPKEIATALDQGFQPVSLGPSRLRTETAALYALTALNLLNDTLS